MSMVVTTPQLVPEDLAEIVAVVRKGLGAAHWSAPCPAPPGAQPPRRPSRPPRPERVGELHCPNHDAGAGRWLPVSAFRPRRDRPGKYQSWCRDCNRAYAASKYLSAPTLAALAGEGVVVATLARAHPLLAQPCPRCDEPWRAEDHIVAGAVVGYHKECLSTEEPDEA